MSVPRNGEPAPPSKWFAAVPLFIASATYLVGIFRFGTPYATHLGNLMQLEFLAVHAGAFLGFFVFWAPSTKWGHVGRIVGILAFGAIYFLGAYGALGWTGILEFGLMIGLTYAGLLIPDRSGARWGRVVEVGVRWVFTTFAFMIIAGIAGTPSDVGTWHEHRSVLVFGAAYFLVLGLVEATGIFGFARRVAAKAMTPKPDAGRP